jgi:signal transduction histidine kinase
MKKAMILGLAAVFALCVTGNVFAQSDAEKECVAKCTDAAGMINKDGLDAAKAEINKKDGKFVKGDIYVFLMDLSGVMLAHPMSPNLIGKNLLDLKDKEGKEFFKEFIALAKEKGSGWVDYMWPKPGEEAPSKKSSYILKVEGKDLIVGAGIYK